MSAPCRSRRTSALLLSTSFALCSFAAVSFMGSFSVDSSEDEYAGAKGKKRVGGGYDDDDDLWADLAGTKDKGATSGGGRSARDRSNDPFIIRSLVRGAAACMCMRVRV